MEQFGVDEVEVFSVDGKPSTNTTRVVDVLTYNWENDELLNEFRHEREDGVRYVFYAHASPPCGPYSSMSCPTQGPLAQRARCTLGRLCCAEVPGANALVPA